MPPAIWAGLVRPASLAALTAMLDTCAILIAYVTDPDPFEAQLTFAMGRHALVDLALVFGVPPDNITVYATLSPTSTPGAALTQAEQDLVAVGAARHPTAPLLAAGPQRRW